VSSDGSAAARGILFAALSTPEAAALHPGLLGELLERLQRSDDDSLAPCLVSFAGADAERRAALTDIIGVAARQLAPDDEPPITGPAAETWRALVTVADRLHGSGAFPLGRPSFVTDRVLGLLVEESRQQMPASVHQGHRATAAPGDVLAALAVSRQLVAAVTGALGFGVVPTYDALFEYDPPGGRVRTHVDSRDYEIVFHLVLEQTSPSGGEAESVLVVHRPLEREPSRVRLRTGEAVVLRGRGTIHSWEPLGANESRTLVAVGFRRTPWVT
jgi:hypothetical protein